MKYLEAQMKMHELYALWWMNYANTEHNKNRTRSANGGKYTPEDLVQDAMETSKRHIELFDELKELIDGRN